MARVKKTFEDIDIRFGLDNATSSLDKFALKAFNQLFYDRKVSRSLVDSFLLGLPDHYSPTLVEKTIYIELLKTKFELMPSSQDFNQSDDIVRVNF